MSLTKTSCEEKDKNTGT